MLMIPGPAEPDPEVLAALAMPILPHYGEKWKEVYDDTTAKLQRIFKTSNDVIIVPVPGQLAVEMAVANLVPKGETAFVCVNGHFSEMIVSMIRYWGGKPVVIRSALGRAVTPAQVAEVLENNDPSGKALFVVQNETSTGVANPVGEILRVCRERQVLTVLDSISAFGGMDVRVDEWGADFAIGYASKAIGGVFGAIPVAVGREAWKAAKENSDRIHTRFLNLNVWAEAIEEMGPWGHPHPSSMPTSVVVGLRKAVDLVLKEGLASRYKRHKEVAELARGTLEGIGLKLFPDKKYLSDTVSVASVTPELDKRLRGELVARYGIMIAGGLGELSGRIIRIGHMGTSATVPAISTTMAAIESVLRDARRRKNNRTR